MAKTTASDIIKLAVSQIGVKESPANSNNVKYNTAYYGREVYGDIAYPWCMVFIWWLFYASSASSLFYDGGRCAGCTTFMKWAKKQTGRWKLKDFRPGDIVLYDFDGNKNDSDHCGIVESVTKNGVVAIEGNTSEAGSQSNGGMVCRKTRPNTVILGVYRPAYKTETTTGTVGTIVNNEGGFDLAKLKTLKQGDKGAQVKALQTLLIGYGYSIYGGADGDFGSYTAGALKKYQQKKLLTTDGICGPQSWASLLGL